MKKQKFLLQIFVLATAVVLTASCKKITEEVIDCMFESAKFTISHTTNVKTVSFSMEYSGDYNLSTTKWDFGDGNTKTVNGNIVEHTYNTTGTYIVKIIPTVTHEGSSCSPELSKTVKID